MVICALIVTVAPVAAETVVLAFGDSLTQGYGLPAEQGFVAQMQRWLTARGEAARLINGGVSGDTTAGGAARANLGAILAEITGRGLPVLLVGLPAPGNFGAEYKAGFEALYPALATEYGALFYPDFMAALTAQGQDSPPLRDLMQADGVHPNAAGVARIVEAMGPQVVELIEAAR